jgi:hypothetical protein
MLKTFSKHVYTELKSIINKQLYDQKLINFEEFKKMEFLIMSESEEEIDEYKISS